ncbi:50S ribosomal protein L23 [Candidatus Saccharibacteria bacterium]|nr:50S ribosomal protein L23 [Candidatus Saccharibacteria bacterium]
MADTEKKTAKVALNLLEPRATEKTYAESMKRTYVFQIKKNVTKQEVATMVEKEFNVTVTDVRTLVRKGKQTKYSKGKHAYPGITHRQDKKFAYVTLKEGDSIKVFETEENHNTSAKDAQMADKVAKKADKTAGKETK